MHGHTTCQSADTDRNRKQQPLVPHIPARSPCHRPRRSALQRRRPQRVEQQLPQQRVAPVGGNDWPQPPDAAHNCLASGLCAGRNEARPRAHQRGCNSVSWCWCACAAHCCCACCRRRRRKEARRCRRQHCSQHLQRIAGCSREVAGTGRQHCRHTSAPAAMLHATTHCMCPAHAPASVAAHHRLRAHAAAVQLSV